MSLRDHPNEGAMRADTPRSAGGVPLEDAEMDNMSDVVGALPMDTANTHSSRDADAWTDIDGKTSELSESGGDEPSATALATAGDDAHDGGDREIDNGNEGDVDMTPEEVADLFGFADEEFELKKLSTPPECSQYPFASNLIIQAYLDYATFTSKVWINYGASEQVFFEGKRATSCGKLHLPKARHQQLAGLHPSQLQFRHVRLDIGTPFRTLVEFSLHVVDNEGGPKLKVRATNKAKKLGRKLAIHLTACYQEIDNLGLTPGYEGITMQDLEVFARVFLRRRNHMDDDVKWEEPKYGGGEWAGQEKPKLMYSFLP